MTRKGEGESLLVVGQAGSQGIRVFVSSVSPIKGGHPLRMKWSVTSCRSYDDSVRDARMPRAVSAGQVYAGNHAEDPPSYRLSKFLLPSFSFVVPVSSRTSSGLSAIWRSPEHSSKSAERDPPHRSSSLVPRSHGHPDDRAIYITLFYFSYFSSYHFISIKSAVDRLSSFDHVVGNVVSRVHAH